MIATTTPHRSEACPDCRTATLDAVPPPAAALPRGALVGRYIVLGAVGAGGMGVVYAAYDPELDRRIALKLVRTPESDADPRSSPRLLSEAQAAARLSHPNVVAVYDAGSFGDCVFLAMELVEGRTLREWLAERERSRREIVRMFILAGRGLAAAHAAGLVHGDFKPENVLVGDDGRVRVADFGLARPAAEVDAVEGGAAEVVRGTPAYMAPEQRRGEPADARSDQFSFCLALWEALGGERPAAGEGSVLRFPPGRLPSWLRQALGRGLSASPAARHPSMDALLAALARDPAAVRRRALMTGAVLATAIAAAGGVWTARDRQRMLCSGGERAAAVWGAAQRQAARAAFLRTGAPFAASAWLSVDRALGTYTSRWAEAHRDACEATRLRGEQSEALLDRRMACLNGRLAEARELARLFARADRQVVERARQAAGSLEGLGECSDTAALMQHVPPPRDPGVRSRVEAARSRLAGAKALQAAGKYPPALAAARAVARQTVRLPYRPVQAEALFLIGDLLENTGQFAASEDTLHQALWAAEESRDDLLRARCLKKLAYTVGYRESRPAEAMRLARHAGAVLRRTGGNALLESALLNTEGAILASQNRLAEALARYRESIALIDRGGAAVPEMYTTLTNIGGIYDRLGDSAAALPYHQRALAIAERQLGALHPVNATLHLNLGIALMSLGRWQEAAPHLERSLADREALLGPDHPDLAESLNALGALWNEAGRPSQALAYLQRAVRLYERSMPGDSLVLVMARNNLGDCLRRLGRFDEALAQLGPALQTLARSRTPDDLFLANALDTVGEIHLDRGSPGAAVPALERACKLFERLSNPMDLAHTQFALARALWEAGHDRPRALRLAQQARTTLAAGGEEGRSGVRQVEEWLARRSAAPKPATPPASA